MNYRDPLKDEGEYANWPDCAIDGCPNKCCLALDSIHCFPHTPGSKHVKHMKIDAANLTSLDIDEYEERRAYAAGSCLTDGERKRWNLP